METDQLRAALERFLWRSIADDAECTCHSREFCPECAAMQALGLGRWTGARDAERALIDDDGDCTDAGPLLSPTHSSLPPAASAAAR